MTPIKTFMLWDFRHSTLPPLRSPLSNRYNSGWLQNWGLDRAVTLPLGQMARGWVGQKIKQMLNTCVTLGLAGTWGAHKGVLFLVGDTLGLCEVPLESKCCSFSSSVLIPSAPSSNHGPGNHLQENHWSCDEMDTLGPFPRPTNLESLRRRLRKTTI